MDATTRERPSLPRGWGVFPQPEDLEPDSPPAPAAPPVSTTTQDLAVGGFTPTPLCLQAVKDAIIHGSGTTKIVPNILKYLETLGVSVPAGSQEAFCHAIALHEWIKMKACSETYSIDLIAEKVASEIRDLPVGKQYIYLGSLKMSNAFPGFWDKVIPENVLEWSKNPKLLAEKLEQIFLESLGGEEALTAATDVQGVLLKGMFRVRDRLQALLPAAYYEGFVKSLELDFDELTGDQIKGTIWETIGKKILEGDLKKSLKDTFQSTFLTLQEDLFHRLDLEVHKASKWIPGPLKPAFELGGVTGLYNPEFWLEIHKEPSGSFRVILHGDDENGTLTSPLPIEWAGLSEELLGPKFWSAVGRFTTWPQRKVECDFSIRDVHETIGILLKTNGAAKTPSINGSSAWAMTNSYLGGVDPTLLEPLRAPEPAKEVIFPSPILPTDKIILPPFFAELVEQYGPKESDYQTVKEVAISVLGKEIEHTLDTLMRELPPR